MTITIKSDSLVISDAIKSFLFSATSLQQAGSIVIATDASDIDFIAENGFSKDDLRLAVEAIRLAIQKSTE